MVLVIYLGGLGGNPPGSPQANMETLAGRSPDVVGAPVTSGRIPIPHNLYRLDPKTYTDFDGVTSQSVKN